MTRARQCSGFSSPRSCHFREGPWARSLDRSPQVASLGGRAAPRDGRKGDADGTKYLGPLLLVRTGANHVSDCDYDQAGAILKWIYGELEPPGKREKGKYIAFDQSPFVSGLGHGLSSEGVVYIPETCAKKGGCRLHIALHGCEQNRDTVGMTFIEGSGFARWADTTASSFSFLRSRRSRSSILKGVGIGGDIRERTILLRTPHKSLQFGKWSSALQSDR